MALHKRLLVFTPPTGNFLPIELERIQVVRTGLHNRNAIDFALDQVLAAPGRPVRKEHYPTDEGRKLSSDADYLLSELGEPGLADTAANIDDCSSNFQNRKRAEDYRRPKAESPHPPDEFEAEFFEWLAAGGRKRASTGGPSRIES